MTMLFFLKPIYASLGSEEKVEKDKKKKLKIIRKKLRKVIKTIKRPKFSYEKYLEEEERAVNIIYDRIKEKRKIEEEEILMVLMEVLD